MRRIKLLWVSSQLFLELACRGIRRPVKVVANALPDDAKVVSAIYREPGTIGLLIESASFPVPEGSSIERFEDFPELDSPMLSIDEAAKALLDAHGF